MLTYFSPRKERERFLEEILSVPESHSSGTEGGTVTTTSTLAPTSFLPSFGAGVSKQVLPKRTREFANWNETGVRDRRKGPA